MSPKAPLPKHNEGRRLLRAYLATQPDRHGAQTVLAAQLQVTPSCVSNLLAGTNAPSLRLAWRLENALRIPCRAWLDRAGKG